MGGVKLWVTSDKGWLVNLDHVRQVTVGGKEVRGQYAGQGEIVLIEATKAEPQHYVDQIALALSNGTLHVDLRQL